jgi:caspase domain-containing protein
MMRVFWIKLCLGAALAAILIGWLPAARASDDTARFYGQWKATFPVNGVRVTVISVHDANGYANYVVSGDTVTFVVSGSYSASNGIWTATPGVGNSGSYHFVDRDTVVCANSTGLVLTWKRDRTPLGKYASTAPAEEADSRDATPGSQPRGFVQKPASGQSDLPPGNYFALVIGINDYSAPIPKLKTAVSDAQSVADLLTGQYGFKVTKLLDSEATRDNILTAITHFRKSLAENDSFLIYYAGHGAFDRETQKGYWLPVDADPDPLVTSRDISADDLTTEVRGLNAQHVLIISDSCFSGDLSRAAGDISPSDGNVAYVHRMQRAPSRTIMASGSDEPVSDAGSQGHSVFAAQLLQAMQSPSLKSFTADDLFVSIRKPVLARSGQSPQYRTLHDSMRASDNLDNGDFVFSRKTSETKTQKPPSK